MFCKLLYAKIMSEVTKRSMSRNLTRVTFKAEDCVSLHFFMYDFIKEIACTALSDVLFYITYKICINVQI